MKKYHIRKYSIAWFLTSEPMKMIYFCGICAALMIGLFKLHDIGLEKVERAYADVPEVEEQEEVIEEETEIPEVEILETEIPEEEITEYSIPLSREMQLYTFETAKAYGLDPEIVIAVIWKESNFNEKCMGDNGNSYGYMQIQARWHQARMNKLNITNLLDGKQNILIGCDVLAEKMEKYGDIHKALMAYNAGDSGAYNLYFSKGIYTSAYSEAVINYAVGLI